MFRRILAALFGTTPPATTDRRIAEQDAYETAMDWASSHVEHYPSHGAAVYGPDFTVVGNQPAVVVGCSHRDHGRNEANHTEPIGA